MKRTRRVFKKWELKYMIRNAGIMTIGKISKKLDRHHSSIQQKMCEIGAHTPQGYTLEQRDQMTRDQLDKLFAGSEYNRLYRWPMPRIEDYRV